MLSLPTARSASCNSIPGDPAGGGYTPSSLQFQAMGTRSNGEVITDNLEGN